MTIADRLREIADDFIVKAPNGGILSERQQYWELRKIADELDAKASEITLPGSDEALQVTTHH